MVSGEEDRAFELKPPGLKYTTIKALLLGGMQALSVSLTMPAAANSLLQIGALAGMVLVLKTSRRPWLDSWAFSISWLSGSVAWLYIALHVHGHMNSILSVLAILLLCAGLSIYYATGLWSYRQIEQQMPRWLAVMLLAAVWTAAELARAQWFTGFPWAAIGYAHVDSFLSFAAPWVGVYGVGFMAVCLAGVLAEVFHRNINSINVMLVVLMSVMLSWPVQRATEQGTEIIRFTLLQGNIDQDLKFGEGRTEALLWYKQAMLESTSDVTVLPETAIPYFAEDLPPSFWQGIIEKFSETKQAAIIGIPTQNKGTGYGNSAMVLGMHSGPEQYDKHHLVPFGEYTPDSLRWVNQLVDFGMTNFKRSLETPKPFEWSSKQLSVNICYEDLFGEELAQRFVLDGVRPPDILVNISNLGWFGNTHVIGQHLNIARMRSLELNRPTVRATNSGGTAVINAQGQIEHVLRPYTRGVLSASVVASHDGITPYAYWAGHWGLKPLWGFCLAIWLASHGIHRLKKRSIPADMVQ